MKVIVSSQDLKYRSPWDIIRVPNNPLTLTSVLKEIHQVNKSGDTRDMGAAKVDRMAAFSVAGGKQLENVVSSANTGVLVSKGCGTKDHRLTALEN